MSSNNPGHSGPTSSDAIKRVGIDMMDSVNYMPGHIRRHRVRALDTTLDPHRKWNPGNKISWVFEKRDFNPLLSEIEFDLVIEEVPCYDSMVTVAGRAREYFRSTIKSRPGITFAQLPHPTERLDHAIMAIHEDPRLLLAAYGRARKNPNGGYEDLVSDSHAQEFPNVYSATLGGQSYLSQKWNAYLEQTNPLEREYCRRANVINVDSMPRTTRYRYDLIDEITIDVDGVMTKKIRRTPSSNMGFTAHNFATINFACGDGGSTPRDIYTYPGVPVTAWATDEPKTAPPGGDADGEDDYGNEYVNDVYVPGIMSGLVDTYSGVVAQDLTLADGALARWASSSNEPYMKLSEPGSVLNYRLKTMKMEMGTNQKLYSEFMRWNQLTPDESLSVYDPYGFATDTSITPNDAHGFSMRNAFGLFQQVMVGTPSNPALITSFTDCVEVMALQSANYENDTNNWGSSAYWGTNRIPDLFQWKNYSNMTMAYYSQYTIPTNTYGKKLYPTTGTPASSNMTTADNRTYVSIANPFPFYHERMVIPIKIPLTLFSGFFGDEFIPHQHMTEQLQLSITLNNFGHALDYGKTDGYSVSTSGPVLDLISFGNARDFVFNVLKLPSWGGWHLENTRANMTYLTFQNAGGDADVYIDAREIYQQRYLAMFMNGVKRGYFHYNHAMIGSTTARDLPSVNNGSSGPKLLNLQATLNDGVIAMICYYHKLDNCNGAWVPLHDACAIEMGMNQNWRYPENQNEILTLEDQHSMFLHAFNKSDTHITNVSSDFVFRYGMPSYRTQTIRREYFKKPNRQNDKLDAGYGFSNPKTGIHNLESGFFNSAYLAGYEHSYPVDALSRSTHPESIKTDGSLKLDTENFTLTASLTKQYYQNSQFGDLAVANTQLGQYFVYGPNQSKAYDFYNQPWLTSRPDNLIAVVDDLYSTSWHQHANVEDITDTVRSLTTTWTHKKLSYEDTCFGIIDFRGDAPTPGTAPGVTMSGIHTGAVLYNTFRANFWINDYSIGERFENRIFEHHIIKVQERVAYYIPQENGQLRLAVETDPSIFTSNAV